MSAIITTTTTISLLKMWLLFIVVCKIDECLFICLTMESLCGVDRDVSSAITASLQQASKQALFARSSNS